MYKPVAPLLVRKDTVDDFAKKYNAEIDNIYKCLSDLRGWRTPEDETELPENLLAIKDGCLTFWDGEKWVTLALLHRGLGITGANNAKPLTTKDIAEIPGQVKKIGAYELHDEKVVLPVNISGTGSIMGFPVEVTDLQEGDGIFFKAALGKWVNAPRGAVGAGASLAIKDGGNVAAIYNGDRLVEYDLGLSALLAQCAAALQEIRTNADRVGAAIQGDCDTFFNDLQIDINTINVETASAINKHNADNKSHKDLRTITAKWDGQLTNLQAQINKLKVAVWTLQGIVNGGN